MGSGSWTTSSFRSYSATKNCSLDSMGVAMLSSNVQDNYSQRHMAKELNPYNVIRECKDSEEHPHTKPVILALDVTGSMGSAAIEVAKKLNVIMTDLYDKVEDVEFMIMGIGDLAYDFSPIQASQFESDIRIAEQLDKVYFEGGGGGNGYESYTAAWFFGLNNTKLDCWDRGERGIIITMGDEALNPYLPKNGLELALGTNLERDVETSVLYEDCVKKFDIYHLNVKHGYNYLRGRIEPSFTKYLDDEHYKEVNLDNISNAIVEIITNSSDTVQNNKTEAISW